VKKLEGVCALVSGAASPIGSALMRELTRVGASVLAADSSEEALERATLQLDEPDEVFSHVLEDGDVVSWWDLANLVGSYFNTLNLFVHIAEPIAPVPVRTLGVDALRAAQSASTDSFVTAIARLEKYLVEASREDEIGACVVAVVPSSEEEGVPSSLCHAATAELARALTDAYREAGLNIRVHATHASSTDPSGAVSAVAELIGQVVAPNVHLGAPCRASKATTGEEA